MKTEKILKLTKPVLTLFSALILAACGGGQSSDQTSTTANAARLEALVVTSTEAALDPSENIHTVFSVKLSDRQGLEQYIAEMNDPSSTNYRKTLSSDEVRLRYGPTEAQIKKITTYLQNKGFTNLKVSSNAMIVEADAPSQLVQSTFNTSLRKYTLVDGSSGRLNKSPVAIPADIADVVTGVYGLDTVNRFRTHQVKAQANATVQPAVSPSGTITGHNPLDYPKVYNSGSTAAATNMTVGIISWGDVTQSVADLHTFERQNALPTTNATVTAAGAAGPDTSATAEWSLDSQSIVAMSGGIRELKFYAATTSSFGDVLVAINTAIQDSDKPQVVNMSFGICDTAGAVSFDNSYFAVAAVQGQTFVASTGDSGSSCVPSPGATPLANTTEYPASSAYVVAVGGTTLGTSGTSYSGETAWAGSGGGVSKYVTAPYWQAVVPSLAAATHRSVADVAFVADPNSGAQIIVNGALAQWGGTSLSAPLFTATWARLLQSCGNNLGFAAPSLYAYAKQNQNMYHDVLSGSNGGYSAATGWDPVTGWGSVNIDSMRTALCPGAGYTAVAQELYVAYLGRPADQGGLAFWANALKNINAPTTLSGVVAAYGSNTALKNLVDSFANGAESQSFYTTSNTTTFVTQIYSTLFNRAPDSSGLTFWSNGINSGGLTKQLAPLSIWQATFSNGGALLDSVTAGNRLAVAMNFTATLTTTQASAYTGTTALASARHLLRNVTSSNDPVDLDFYFEQPIYVNSYQPSVNAAINSIVAGIPY